MKNNGCRMGTVIQGHRLISIRMRISMAIGVLDIPPLCWNGHQRDILDDDRKSDDVTIVSALRHVLSYQGFPISKKMIAGLSGAAFYIGWNRDTLSSGMGGAVFQFPHMARGDLFNDYHYCGIDLLFRYAGFDVEILSKNDSSLFQKCKDSIDRNIPLVAMEWNPISRRGHAAVLCGISSKQNSFLGRIYDHERCHEFMTISPENLHYVILQKQQITKKQESSLIFSSFQNALSILRGNPFKDRENWTLGIQSYLNQIGLIRKDLDRGAENYKLIEHFLFWRLQILLACRTYASLYVGEILSRNLYSSQTGHLLELKGNYEDFAQFFNGSIRIQNSMENIIKGTPLIWKSGNGDILIEELFRSKEGIDSFCDFLYELYRIDSRGVDILGTIVESST